MANQMDPSIVREIRSIRGNDMCVDCLSPNPQWASISFGTLFCLDCSGQHRGLGVHISFVRSVTMDSWSDQQINMMRKGGNAKLREWFSERGVPNNMRISAKYHVPDAEYYSKRLKAIVDGKEVPAMPPRQPVDTSVDYSKGDPNGKEKLKGEADEDYITRQKKLNAEAKARMAAKFGGGGRMGGVGSDPSYDPNSQAGGGGVDVGSLVSGIGTLWGSVAAKTKEVVAVAHEDLRSRELGKKVTGGWHNTVEATKGAWQSNVNEETRTKISGTAKGLWGTITHVVAGDEEDEWDDWGDEKKKRFPRSASNNQNIDNSGGSEECVGLAGEDRNGPGQLTGESEAQYVQRQTRIRDEAKERMRLKFGGGALGGASSGGASGGGGGVVAECVGLAGEDRNGPGQLTGESESQYVQRQTRIRDEAKERMRLKFGGGAGGMAGVGASTTSSSTSTSSYSQQRNSPPPAPALNIHSKYEENASSFNEMKPPSPLSSSTSTPSLANLKSPSPPSRVTVGGMSRSASTNNTPKSPDADIDFFSDFGM